MAGRVFAGMPRVFGKSLGEEVAYTPVDGVVSYPQGVFSADYYATMAGGEVQAESAKPAVSLAVADCPAAGQGDAFVIAGTSYTAVEIQPDSFGMVVFILQEA